MPNPLMRLGTPVQSKDPERPEGAITPVPEPVVGTVFAYRGMEKHGVEPTQDWRNVEDYEGNYERSIETYEAPDDGIEPIPVYIVDTADKGRQFVRGITFRGYATGTGSGNASRNVISADYQGRRRTRVRIKNMDTTTVYVGFTADQASAMHGWPLAQNEVFEHVGEDDIWALGTGVNDSPLAVAVEFAVVING